MLPNSNNRALQNRGVNEEVFFFYQRWQEFVESRTLDMYQYNILNSCVAGIELADVIDKTLSGLLTSRQNIDDSKAEALELLKADDVLEKHNKPLRNTLLRILSTKIDSKSRGESIEDKNSSFYISLNRLKYQLKTPVRMLANNYITYLLDELRADIGINNYALMEKHMAMVISQCIYRGWSARGLLLLSKLFEGSNTLEEKWNCFAQKLQINTENQFEIYYSIKMETRSGITSESIREVISSLGLDLKKGNQIIDGNAARQNLYNKISSTTNYIAVSINATDLYAAALSSINLLNSRLSVATFYNIVSPWIASSPQIVIYSVTDNLAEALTMTDVFKTYDYIDSNNNVFSDTNRILINAEKVQIMNKLNAAFSYTNLSRSSFFQETKYISLWIAIESVMRTGQYSDIISHIKFVLPEILSVRYIYRIVRNFSEDCIRCGFKNHHDDNLTINMENPDKKRLVSDLIHVFRTPTQFVVFQARCQVNELLNYRCQEIHSLLNSTEAIIAKLEHYTTKVRWHIQRLYRIRNEITHSAFQENKSLMIYIEHLYAYLAQLISEVVYYVEHKNSESVEEAFATILESYNTYIDLLKEGNLTIQQVLPTGVIDIVV